MRQGNEVGASAIGELTRTKDKVKLQFVPVYCYSQCLCLNTIDFISLLLGCNKSFYELMAKYHNMVKCFSSTISNSKNCDHMLDKHRYLHRNK